MTARERMALDTLRRWRSAGMRDHVGGGFHRYSVDAEWRVPHFEKMLYDQAQLVLAYLEASQVSGEAFYATVAEDTLDYVTRDLTVARRRVLFGRRRGLAGRGDASRPASSAGQATKSAHAEKARRRVLRLDRRRDRSLCSATMRRSCGGGSASRTTATRWPIRRGSFAARTSCTSRSRSRTSPRGPAGRWTKSWRRSDAARDDVRRARRPAPAASRRQSHHRLERTDDRRLRARGARARRQPAPRGLAPRRRARGRPRSRRTCGGRPSAGCCAGSATARRRSTGFCEDYACLDLGPHRAVPGDRATAAGSSGRSS